MNYLEQKKNTIFEKYSSKMAIPEYKNGHFEEMAAWLQILEIVGNSTLIYLLFDTHDIPGHLCIEMGFF